MSNFKTYPEAGRFIAEVIHTCSHTRRYPYGSQGLADHQAPKLAAEACTSCQQQAKASGVSTDGKPVQGMVVNFQRDSKLPVQTQRFFTLEEGDEFVDKIRMKVDEHGTVTQKPRVQWFEQVNFTHIDGVVQETLK